MLAPLGVFFLVGNLVYPVEPDTAGHINPGFCIVNFLNISMVTMLFNCIHLMSDNSGLRRNLSTCVTNVNLPSSSFSCLMKSRNTSCTDCWVRSVAALSRGGGGGSLRCSPAETRRCSAETPAPGGGGSRLSGGGGGSRRPGDDLSGDPLRSLQQPKAQICTN